MFNKINTKGKVSVFIKNDLVEFDNYLLSVYLLEKLSKKELLDPNKETMIVEYISDYHKRMMELFNTRKYDRRLINLHYDGKVILDGKEYNIFDFYMKYKYENNKLENHLLCTKEPYKDILLKSNEDYGYNDSIQFRQTTAFINMLESEAVMVNYPKNTIEVVNKDLLLEIINNWDGMIHDKVPETDALDKKNLIG